MPLRPVQSADRPLIERLLAENPFKEDQIRFQKLDRERLVRFHLDRLMARVDDPERPLFIYETPGNRAVFGFVPATHHSIFFDKCIFSLDPVITYNLTEREKREGLMELGVLVEKRDPDILWCRSDESEGDLVQCLAHVGGKYCGTSVRLSRWVDQPSMPEEPAAVTIRPAEPSDLLAVRRVAGTSHQYSHFFRDPFLPGEKRREIFPHYVGRCFGKPARPLLIAEEDSGEPIGFSLLLLPESQDRYLGRRVGIIDFIAVRTEGQGRGIGKALLMESIRLIAERGYEVVELKTMLDNRQAIGFYQRYGFRLLSAEFHFSIGRKASPQW